MRWLLFHKLSDGSWHPMLGPLSEFPECLVLLVPILVAPAALIVQILRDKAWQHGKECRRAVWWAASAYLLVALWAARNSCPEGSPPHQVLQVIARIAVTGWAVVGVWKVIPALGRCETTREGEHSP